MEFQIVEGDVHHEHWFVWFSANTEAEAWAGNMAVEKVMKEFKPFCQFTHNSNCVWNCKKHMRCPATYGWEMWALSMSNNEGREKLANKLEELNKKFQELLEAW